MTDRVIKDGDYVPSELIYPEWGNGTYRVFKFRKAKVKMADKQPQVHSGNPNYELGEEFKKFPDGEHDDNTDSIPFTDSLIKTPMRLTRWFNIVMAVINLSTAILFLVLVPVFVGFLIIDDPTNWYDWALVYGVGLTTTGAIMVGLIYWGLIFSETRKGIGRNIDLIRKKIR